MSLSCRASAQYSLQCTCTSSLGQPFLKKAHSPYQSRTALLWQPRDDGTQCLCLILSLSLQSHSSCSAGCRSEQQGNIPLYTLVYIQDCLRCYLLYSSFLPLNQYNNSQNFPSGHT